MGSVAYQPDYRIRGGELELPEPTQSNQTWVRVRDNADGPELVDLGESKGKWKLIEWDPNAPRQDVWDMGHISEAKYSKIHERYMNKEISTEEFLEEYHDSANYEVQDPRRNRAHDDE